ncbi:MAG TPA: DUF4249 family protein [Longimicrobium sp.]|nr:DUF4249 family protein [Longimicrobium sp.]
MLFRMMTAAAAVLVLAGCTIADVTVPPSDDRLVIEAVLRTDIVRQTILLHRSVREQTSVGETGARVVVTGGGRTITFAETTDPCYTISADYEEAEVAVDVACYASPGQDGRWVQPGQTYELRVETARGEVARAITTVPGAFSANGIRTTSRNDRVEPVCWLPPATPLPLSWTPSPGAWGYLVPLTIFGLSGTLPPSFNAPDPMELVGVSVSASDTTLVLPGEFGVFDRFDFNQDLLRALQGGLPDETAARVVIAAADRNYINGVRGGNFNPSGQVRVSSIAGDGVGVFGSLTTLTFLIDVGPPSAGFPACIGQP